MTFSAGRGPLRGCRGPPQVTTSAFSVPKDALGFWSERLRECRVAIEPSETRFGEPVLGFTDPDGLRLELVASAETGERVATGGPVPDASSIRGFHGVTLSQEGYGKNAHLLTEGI